MTKDNGRETSQTEDLDAKAARLQQQINFILEIDKEKNILRQTHLTGHGHRENDAEHAWHMAIMVWLLQEYANRPFDLGRTMLMCLIHDLVEIDAGDTYAYDSEGKKTQADREEKAADRIFALLPEDQGKTLRALFEEFNQGETPEAAMARAMDNFQPLLLNNSNGGGDWREHQVTREQVEKRQCTTKDGSAYLYRKTEEILDDNVQNGSLRTGEKAG